MAIAQGYKPAIAKPEKLKIKYTFLGFRRFKNT